MRAATGAAIRRTEPHARNRALHRAVQRAFAAPRAQHVDDPRCRGRKQVIARVYVAACRELTFSEPADGEAERLRNLDQQLKVVCGCIGTSDSPAAASQTTVEAYRPP